MSNFPETLPLSYQEFEKAGGSLPVFPEISKEDLAEFSLQDLHQFAVESLEEYPGRQEVKNRIKYPLFSYLLMRPGHLLGESDSSPEERRESTKITKILEQAVFTASSPTANPIYRAAVYSNLKLYADFIETRSPGDPQGRRVRGLTNSLSAEIASSITLLTRAKVLVVDPEEYPEGLYMMVAVAKADKIALMGTNEDPGLLVDAQSDVNASNDFHATLPQRALIGEHVLRLLEPGMQTQLRELNQRGRLYRTRMIFRPQSLPGLDPNLPQDEALRKLAAPPERYIRGIMSFLERKLPK